MSFEKLSESLHTLQESNATLKELIDSLANLNFQPGSVPLDDDEDNMKTEILSDIHQTIKDQNDDFEVLQQGCKSYIRRLPKGEDRVRAEELGRGAERAMQELRSLEAAARKARLSAQKRLQIARRQERDILVRSYQQADIVSRSGRSSPMPGQPPRTPQTQMFSREDKMVGATSNVTLALRRTHDMMAAELSRSQYAHEQLLESTAVLDQLGETYSTLDSLLSNSKNLLGTLLRSQKSDTWYLETAFWVLSITIGWLIFRRLLYGPTWWLIWLPLKIIFKAWIGVLSAMGVIGGSSMDVGASSMVGSQTAILGNSARATVAGSDATVINAGQDRNSGSRRDTDIPQGEETLSEQVGRMIDGEENEEDAEYSDEDLEDNLEDNLAQAPRNPKKRMWEVENEAPKVTIRKRDEL